MECPFLFLFGLSEVVQGVYGILLLLFTLGWMGCGSFRGDAGGMGFITWFGMGGVDWDGVSWV